MFTKYYNVWLPILYSLICFLDFDFYKNIKVDFFFNVMIFNNFVRKQGTKRENGIL